MEVDNLSSATRAVQTCILCKTDTCEKLTDAGIATLHTSCEIRRNVDLLEYLDSNPGTDLFVHASCRKSFTRSSDLKRLKLQLEEPTDTRTLRSACLKLRAFSVVVLLSVTPVFVECIR